MRILLGTFGSSVHHVHFDSHGRSFIVTTKLLLNFDHETRYLTSTHQNGANVLPYTLVLYHKGILHIVLLSLNHDGPKQQNTHPFLRTIFHIFLHGGLELQNLFIRDIHSETNVNVNHCLWRSVQIDDSTTSERPIGKSGDFIGGKIASRGCHQINTEDFPRFGSIYTRRLIDLVNSNNVPNIVRLPNQDQQYTFKLLRSCSTNHERK
mmetsp:Transcript_3221/g.6623  ORF Transcript_3221/g.6623 Transcript_3221/m.6623 type:complete len:208 (+) Transcript_3221:129-752(+)